jgi:hypothetical protein
MDWVGQDVVFRADRGAKTGDVPPKASKIFGAGQKLWSEQCALIIVEDSQGFPILKKGGLGAQRKNALATCGLRVTHGTIA